MFKKSVEFYDAIYEDKDYVGEAARVHELVQAYGRSEDDTLLDVACGTGRHLTYLDDLYRVEGLDIEADLLAIARQRHPEITFHRADMVDFDLGRRFNVVTCLFSAIGYVRQEARLRQAVETMARHLEPGGVVIVEPWLTPDQYQLGHLAARFVDRPDLKISRMSISKVDGMLSVMDMHHLVATPEGIHYFVERHELAMFTHEQYLEAFEIAGLEPHHDSEGLTGRGLYIGVRPL